MENDLNHSQSKVTFPLARSIDTLARRQTGRTFNLMLYNVSVLYNSHFRFRRGHRSEGYQLQISGREYSTANVQNKSYILT